MFTCSFKVLTASSNILRKWWIGVSSVISDIADWCKKKSPVFLARLFQQSLCLLVEQWTWPGNAWETNVILRKGVIFTEKLKKEKWFWRRFSPLDRKRRGWGCMMALSRWSPGRHLKKNFSEKVFFWKVFVQRCFLHDPGSLTLPVNNNIQTAFNYICNVQEDETLVS